MPNAPLQRTLIGHVAQKWLDILLPLRTMSAVSAHGFEGYNNQSYQQTCGPILCRETSEACAESILSGPCCICLSLICGMLLGELHDCQNQLPAYRRKGRLHGVNVACGRLASDPTSDAPGEIVLSTHPSPPFPGALDMSLYCTPLHNHLQPHTATF